MAEMVRVRWAFCAADQGKNGKVDHVDRETAETFAREGRLSLEPLEEPAVVSDAPADPPAKPKK